MLKLWCLFIILVCGIRGTAGLPGRSGNEEDTFGGDKAVAGLPSTNASQTRGVMRATRNIDSSPDYPAVYSTVIASIRDTAFNDCKLTAAVLDLQHLLRPHPIYFSGSRTWLQ